MPTKKVKGIKRNIAADRNVFILCLIFENAGKHDSKLAYPLCRLTSFFWPTLMKILVDIGYRGVIADLVMFDFMIELEVSNAPNGTKDFTPKPLRWVVKWTFACLDGFGRITRNYEQSDDSAEEMIDFATVKLLINHIYSL